MLPRSRSFSHVVTPSIFAQQKQWSRFSLMFWLCGYVFVITCSEACVIFAELPWYKRCRLSLHSFHAPPHASRRLQQNLVWPNEELTVASTCYWSQLGSGWWHYPKIMHRFATHLR